MKRLVVFYFLIFTFFSVVCQNYQRMVVENAWWQIAYFVNTNVDPRGYKIHGDTVINGTAYKMYIIWTCFPTNTQAHTRLKMNGYLVQ